MRDIKERTIQECRAEIGGGAWLKRDGDTITVSYDYAGRVTKADQTFSVSEIEELAQFVRDTTQSQQGTDQ